jgi:hypothetical protein
LILTERELDNHLRDLVESLGIRNTTDNFIIERDNKRQQFQATDNQEHLTDPDKEKKRLAHADCIFLETILIEEGLVLPSTDILHDFGVDDYNYVIDNKDIQGNYYYPKIKNIKWMEDGIASGKLTHLMFTRMYRPIKETPLKAGDPVKIDYLKLVNAKFVFDNLEDYKKQDGSIVKRFRVL